jgi:hypothetical protein
VINYQIISDSIKFYERYGFQRIESPWTVTQSAAAITKPDGCDNFTINEKNKVLVASGEQSFLYLYMKGYLPKGKFQTVTPCFRNDSFDSLHTKYFIKNELIQTDFVTIKNMMDVMDVARLFFQSVLNGKVDIVRINKYSYDINYKGIELGSYGIRKCDFLTWIYGTGVAEPRLSGVIKKYEQ